MKFNAKPGASDTKVKGKDDAKKNMESHDSVELSKELTNAINWLAAQFATIRAWIGRDGRDYCTITVKRNASPPKPYEDVGAVAEAVIDNLKEIGAENGVAVFASYDLSFKGNRGVGRLISVTDERKLVFALEIEYTVSSTKAGIQTMVPRGDKETDDDVKASTSKAGFGALN